MRSLKRLLAGVLLLAATAAWGQGAPDAMVKSTVDEVLAQGNAVPDLRLDLHVYAQNPAERFVFINMRKLREGDASPEGVRVDEITPNGVELSYRGKRFALAGN